MRLLLELINCVLQKNMPTADWFALFADQCFSAESFSAETFSNEVLSVLSLVNNLPRRQAPAKILADMGDLLIKQPYSYSKQDPRPIILAHACYLGARSEMLKNNRVVPENLLKYIIMAQKTACLIQILNWTKQDQSISAAQHLKNFHENFTYQSDEHQSLLKETIKFFKTQLSNAARDEKEKYQIIFDSFTPLSTLLQESNTKLVTNTIRPVIHHCFEKLQNYNSLIGLNGVTSSKGIELGHSEIPDEVARFLGLKGDIGRKWDKWNISQEHDTSRKRKAPHDEEAEKYLPGSAKRPKL
jgi:hypothetical protein